MKIKKKIPLIDQHDKNFYMVVNLVETSYETLKPIDDLNCSQN